MRRRLRPPKAGAAGRRPQNVWASQRPTARATVVALDSDMTELSHTLSKKTTRTSQKPAFPPKNVHNFIGTTEHRKNINKNLNMAERFWIPYWLHF